MPISMAIKERLVRSYKRDALNNDADGAGFLSVCYGSGFGVEVDENEMISWAIKAAECGNLDAVKNIASQYDIKRDPRHYARLFPWILIAAVDGHHDSMDKVARCYLYGIGVEPNYRAYQKWLQRSGNKSLRPGQPFPIEY